MEKIDSAQGSTAQPRPSERENTPTVAVQLITVVSPFPGYRAFRPERIATDNAKRWLRHVNRLRRDRRTVTFVVVIDPASRFVYGTAHFVSPAAGQA
jgi:hypothetical protein